jgi:hypothetical protein
MPQEKVLLVQALVYEMKMKIEALASRLPVGVLAKQKKTTGIPEYVTGIPVLRGHSNTRARFLTIPS